MLNSRWFSAALVISLLFLATPGASAGDASFGEDSIIVISVDDWQKYRAGYSDSDWGQFLREPTIVETLDRFSKGIDALLSGVNPAMDEDGEDIPNPMRVMGVVGDQFKMLLEKMTGRCAISIGYQMTPMGPFPNIVIECRGPEEVAEVKNAILDVIKKEVPTPLMPANFMAGEMGFEGVEGMPGVGIYFGRNGDQFAIGTSRSGLRQYFDTEGTSVGARFGSTPTYKAARNLTTPGDMTAYFNLDPIWKLVPFFTAMLDGPQGEDNDEAEPVGDGDGFDGEDDEDEDEWADATDDGFPDVAKILEASGLTSMHGFVTKAQYTSEGAISEMITAFDGRKGFLKLVPTSNKSVSIPRLIPSDAAAVGVYRVAFDQIIPLIKEFATAVGGEEATADVESGIQMMSEEMGINIEELLANIEGTFAAYTPAADPDAPAVNPMMMMMGGGAAIDTMLMLRLKDTEPMKKVIETLSGQEMMGETLQRKEIAGREVLIYDPLADTPAEFAPQGGPALKPAMTFEGNWFVFSTSEKLLSTCLDAEDGGLSARSDIEEMVARVGGTEGTVLSYADLGEVLAQQADLIRPILGFLPLMVPELGSNEDIQFLFDTDNVPSSDLIKKFFGPMMNRSETIPGGSRTIYWMPRVTTSAEESAPEKEVRF